MKVFLNFSHPLNRGLISHIQTGSRKLPTLQQMPFNLVNNKKQFKKAIPNPHTPWKAQAFVDCIEMLQKTLLVFRCFKKPSWCLKNHNVFLLPHYFQKSLIIGLSGKENNITLFLLGRELSFYAPTLVGGLHVFPNPLFRWRLSLLLGVNLSRWGLRQKNICFQRIV